MGSTRPEQAGRRDGVIALAMTEGAPLAGVLKGGNAPFGIKLYKFLPLPRQRGSDLRRGLGAGGGRGWAEPG